MNKEKAINIVVGVQNYLSQLGSNHYAAKKLSDVVVYLNNLEVDDIPEPTHGAVDGREGVEWDGEGFPPVGAECEVYGVLGLYNQWHECRVFAVELGQVFITNGKDLAQRSIDSIQLKPLETPEQKAERELDELADKCRLTWLGANDTVWSEISESSRESWRAVAKVKLDNK